MTEIITLNTTRTDYGAKEAALRSITVGELISLLEQYDEDSKVIFSNDNGYTYGRISDWQIGTIDADNE